MAIILRFFKKLDEKNRVLIPSAIIKKVKSKEYYIELLDDNTIRLIPIKNKGEN
jgi:hypothetical protein|nr:MAG TPA: MraZ protein [Caudoviricetes sp.]